MTHNPRVALVFPGQGAQFVGMGRDICRTFPVARAIFDLADEVLGFALSHLCFEGPEDELRETVNAQPAILTLSLALLGAIQHSPRPITAELAAGHSLGEYSALAATKALSVADAVSLARRRGELMQQAGKKNPGAMSAVIGLDRLALDDICQETGVFIASFNSPDQTVISGCTPDVKNAERLAKERGARKVTPLQVSGAFHTPFMAQTAEELAAAIDEVTWANPCLPVIGNTTAAPLSSTDAVKNELTRQLTHPIRWQESIETMTAKGVDTFVEIGPGRILSGLIKRINPAARTVCLGDSVAVNKYLAEGLAS